MSFSGSCREVSDSLEMRPSGFEMHQRVRTPHWEQTYAMVSQARRAIAEARAAVSGYRAAAERMRSAVAAAREALARIRYHPRYGIPYQEIAAAALELTADLVIIATHGRTGLSHALSSTDERVVRQAPCPVLTLRRSTAS
jgi:nucleotide-binding universal stress UspA family protein